MASKSPCFNEWTNWCFGLCEAFRHGDTDSDSHKTLPVVDHTKARIDTVDLIPFKRLIDAELPLVMVAHLNVPSLDSTEKQSQYFVALRGRHYASSAIKFSGLTFDALNMKGVSSFNSEPWKAALQAGNDVLLFPEDIPAAFTAIKKAIQDSSLTEDRINQSRQNTKQRVVGFNI